MPTKEEFVRTETSSPTVVEHVFHKIQAYHFVFKKNYDGGDFLILLLYVDDMTLIVG